ncbi:MAG: hypothetical protein HYR96_06645 [Deltaproteobacteria bacterium]|nr:hypothetical protein [Deltaproteobacteria bacterium]MBI3296460.1 hypothetical protein [Deltaproteobacteria bacterium]
MWSRSTYAGLAWPPVRFEDMIQGIGTGKIKAAVESLVVELLNCTIR